MGNGQALRSRRQSACLSPFGRSQLPVQPLQVSPTHLHQRHQLLLQPPQVGVAAAARPALRVTPEASLARACMTGRNGAAVTSQKHAWLQEEERPGSQRNGSGSLLRRCSQPTADNTPRCCRTHRACTAADSASAWGRRCPPLPPQTAAARRCQSGAPHSSCATAIDGTGCGK